MLTERALAILAKYEILERDLDRQARREAFEKTAKTAEWVPATKQTRLAGIQGW